MEENIRSGSYLTIQHRPLKFLTTEQTLASFPPHLTSILHWSGKDARVCSVVRNLSGLCWMVR